MDAPPATPPRGAAGLVLAVAVVAAAVVLASVWSAPDRALVGDWQHPDMLSNHWVYAWVADQLAAGGTLLHNDRYYVPVGDAPFLAGNASGALLAAPFLWALGHPLGLNVYVGIVLVANVVAGAALARAIGAGPLPAIVAGTGFGLCPYLLTELSAARFAQVPAWELAGGLALWIGALRGPSLARAAGAGLLFGLAGVEYFYYGLFGGMSAGLLALTAARAAPARLRSPRWLGAVALGGGLATATVLPLLIVFVRGWSTVVGASEAESTFPHPFMLQAALPWSWPLWTDVRTMVPTHVSWVLLGLAVVEWRAARKDPEGWASQGLVLVGVVGWLLSLGPQLMTPVGPAEGSHLPFWWLYGAHPALSRFWWPYRHAVLVSLAVAALAARALSRVHVRLPPMLGILAVGGTLVAVPLELRTRGAVVVPEVSRLKPEPAWVDTFRALPDGVVLDLPMAPELWIAQQHLTLQRLHGHALLDGHAMWVDRVRPDAWDARVEASTFLSELQRFERGQPVEGDPARIDRFVYDPADVKTLMDDGVRWIVLWDELYAGEVGELPAHEETLLRALFGDPVVEGEGLAVFDVAKHQGDGDLPAPDWDWPAGVATGDGSSRMTEDLPASTIVELSR